MEETSTQVSPSMYPFNEEIELKEDNDLLDKGETKSFESKCSICGKVLSSKKNMKKHYKLHSEERNYICKICDKSYKRSDHLKRHMITHDPESVHGGANLKIYKCPDCDECFHKKSKLFLHQKKIHNLKVDKIPCYYPYCNRSYISEQKLNYHIQHTHMNLINNSKEGIFQNQKNIDNDIIFNCNNLDNMNKDLDSENSLNEKKFFRCPYKECLKVYSSHYNLSVHIKTFHLKIKSFVCYLCGNKYFHKVSLKNHLMIEHKLNQNKLQDALNKKIELKDEIIQQAKKDLEMEGLYKEESFEKDKNLSLNNSRKISEDGSHESKNNEFFVKEFHNNLFNEINMIENKIES